ncbi:histidine kinase [Algibacter mikhailovii]|uniref:Histidine kinase n=2 Tax=Algibacter mikhailovii TaxID=425498 RepID=A0A918R4T9_9FLAO|nr:histidine kinase [Algibacter mikhailovii]
MRWGNYFDNYVYSFKSNVVEFAIHIIIVYGNVFYLIPKFILRKKYKTYVAIMFLILVLVYVIRTSLNYILVTEQAYPESVVPSSVFDFNYIVQVILGELYVISFVTSIKFIAEWFIEKKKNENLAKLQLSTELKFLRTQIQPHFFFNTLNNLYALTLQKSDNAPKLVIKLSEMMQYVLYDIDGSRTDLLNEINHINNYIDIERLRFNDRVEVDIDISGDIEDVYVPPLLLLSFIENCFKHGMRGNDKLKINMSFEVLNSGYLEFVLINTFNPIILQDAKSGIGNDNAKRRLNLMFSNNFVLESKIEEDKYKLFLKIPIR